MSLKISLSVLLSASIIVGLSVPATGADNPDILEPCRLSEPAFTGPHSKGSPIQNNMTPFIGTVNVAIIPLDFHNASATPKMSIRNYKKSLADAVAS